MSFFIVPDKIGLSYTNTTIKGINQNKRKGKTMCYNDFESMPMTLSIQDIADTLRIGRHSAYVLARSGKLEILRIGTQIRVTRAAFIKFLESGAVEE